MRMPFGKHRGEQLEDLPDEYVDWLLSLRDLRDPLLTAVRAEAARRAGRETGSRGRPARLALPADLRPVARELVTAGLKALARRHHPDAGGDHEAMVRVNTAAEMLRRAIGDAP